jgi:hypothetical protein
MSSHLNYQQLSASELVFFVEKFPPSMYKAGERELKGGITRLKPQEQTNQDRVERRAVRPAGVLKSQSQPKEEDS